MTGPSTADADDRTTCPQHRMTCTNVIHSRILDANRALTAPTQRPPTSGRYSFPLARPGSDRPRNGVPRPTEPGRPPNTEGDP